MRSRTQIKSVRLEMETNGGDGACTDTRSVETGHVDFGTVSGSSIQPFAIGLVANDVTSVEINSVNAPILKNNFFLAPISDPNPPFNITIHRSDGRPYRRPWVVSQDPQEVTAAKTGAQSWCEIC